MKANNKQVRVERFAYYSASVSLSFFLVSSVRICQVVNLQTIKRIFYRIVEVGAVFVDCYFTLLRYGILVNDRLYRQTAGECGDEPTIIPQFGL